MLSELLWGSWLSTGMRVPEAFGLLPYMKHDHVYLLSLFSACRLITEHLFTMQTLPVDNKLVNRYFNVGQVNNFICDSMQLFIVHYMKLL